MSIHGLKHSDPTWGWRDVYMAALFELDPCRIAERITEAEKQLIARERELFSVAEAHRERNAITAALHALRALRTCCAESKLAA